MHASRRFYYCGNYTCSQDYICWGNGLNAHTIPVQSCRHRPANQPIGKIVEVVLAQLTLQMPALVIDGSVVGRGCMALMVPVVYNGRELPLAWLVRRSKRSHFPEELDIAPIKQVQEHITLGTQVVVLSDGVKVVTSKAER